ncbi:hypothetical protein RHMOL_Rhmol07G0141900 [Rhododendron molle]|uniref:Uncharacterized protein n=1 Tax=Rhododendron molle TaxID=49168 RepID=A0ACC0N0R9_RHOML|nr:hypothetical protein RHMOL_Rhmol07G0141900 [Rhododendron molle]
MGGFQIYRLRSAAASGLSPGPVLLDHLIGKEGDDHDPLHLAPVLTVDGEHLVLAFALEDVEQDLFKPNSNPWVWITSLEMSGVETTTRLRWPIQAYGAGGSHRTVVQVVVDLEILEEGFNGGAGGCD